MLIFLLSNQISLFTVYCLIHTHWKYIQIALFRYDFGMVCLENVVYHYVSFLFAEGKDAMILMLLHYLPKHRLLPLLSLNWLILLLKSSTFAIEETHLWPLI